MTRKLQLNVKYEPNFEVVGIFTGLKNYRLCWLINNKLSLKLYRIADISLTPYKSKSGSSFSLFLYENEDIKVKYYLLSNRSEQNVLLPEPKSLDYLMLLKAKDFRIDINDLVLKLQGIPQIAAAVRFKETEKIKNLNNVLYDFEISLIDMLKK